MANDNDIIARLKVEGQDKFKADLLSASQSTNELTVNIKKMEDTIAQLPKGSKEFERLSNELEAVKIATEAGNTAFESSKAQLRQLKEQAAGLATVLATLKSEGKQNTQTFKDIQKEFESTKRRAGELTDKIGDINAEISALGSDTRGIDNIVRGTQLMANTFQFAVGVQALLGKENENLNQALIKLNGVMAVSQSLQQIGNELTREDSIITMAVTKAKQLYTAAMTGASRATQIFYGIATGGLILALTFIATNWEKIAEALGFATENTDKLREATEKLKKAEEDRRALQDAELRYYKAKGLSQDQIIRKEIAIARAELTTLEKKINLEKNLAGFYNSSQYNPNLFKDRADAQKRAEEVEKSYAAEVLNAKSKILELQKALESTGKEQDKFVQKTVEANKEFKGLAVAVPYVMDAFKNLDEQIESTTRLLVEQFSASEALNEDASENPTVIYLANLLKQLKIKREQLEAEFELLTNRVGAVGEQKGQAQGGVSTKPPTLFERIFGTEKDNIRQAQGALKIIEQINSYGAQVSSVASQAIEIRTANDLQLLDEKKNKGLIKEQEYEKESARIKNEAAKKKRAIDIANATAQIPVAVLSAYIAGMQVGGLPGTILAGVLAGVAGAFATAQVALIASAPLPKFKKGGSVAKRLGLIKGAKHEQGGVPIEVEGDEFVMQSKATKKYGVKMLDDINNLRFNPVLASQGKIKEKSNYKLYENLSTISSYLKQGYKIDAKGNEILMDISNNLKQSKIYV